VHYSFKLMQAANASHLLLKTDLLSLFVGGLCHDCDHRGRNSAFEVVTRSEIALRYNDISVLENHHCATAFEIAFHRKHEDGMDCNIFAALPTATFDHIRHRIVSAILSTDMKHHGKHVEHMQTFELEHSVNPAQCQFLVELFLHTADIGNPVMPRDIARRWGEAISQEFVAQAEEEQQMGLPVTAFMDGLLDPVVAAKSQLGFISFVLFPLLDPMLRVFPGMADARTHLDINKEANSEIVEQANNATKMEVLSCDGSEE
jgi:hypothetical protein